MIFYEKDYFISNGTCYGNLLFVAGVLNTVAAQKITMYSTTASERWASQKVTVLKHASQTPEVSVYMDSLLQHVTGFGGTFNEIGWNALQSLSGRT